MSAKQVTIIPMVKGAESLPREVTLLSADANQIVVQYRELYNAVMTVCTATIPANAVAYVERQTENTGVPVIKTQSPKATPKTIISEEQPLVISAPQAKLAAPVVPASAASVLKVPGKRGPKPKPRDANGNIIRTPVAPPVSLEAAPEAPAKISGIKPIRRAKAAESAEAEFAPEEVTTLMVPKAKPVSKYRKEVTEDGETDDLTADDLGDDLDASDDSDSEFDF